MAREEGQELYLGFWWGHLAVDRGIILKWILKI